MTDQSGGYVPAAEFIADGAKPVGSDGLITAGNLRCEYLVNPLGIDVMRPRLSWKVQTRDSRRRQTAYRICVASTPARLAAGPDIWDSDKRESSDTSHLPYEGPGLSRGRRVYWQVQLWDDDDLLLGAKLRKERHDLCALVDVPLLW